MPKLSPFWPHVGGGVLVQQGVVRSSKFDFPHGNGCSSLQAGVKGYNTAALPIELRQLAVEDGTSKLIEQCQ